jgi:acyl carrier protein
LTAKEDDILARVAEIIRDQFDDDTLTVDRGTVAADIPGWDSIAHIQLIVAFEKAFRVHFVVGETYDLPTLGSLVARIAEKQGV